MRFDFDNCECIPVRISKKKKFRREASLIQGWKNQRIPHLKTAKAEFAEKIKAMKPGGVSRSIVNELNERVEAKKNKEKEEREKKKFSKDFVNNLKNAFKKGKSMFGPT